MWSSTIFHIVLGWNSALASPEFQWVERTCRDNETPFFLGASDRSTLRFAQCIDWNAPSAPGAAIGESLAPERNALENPSEKLWSVQPTARVSIGRMTEPYQSGDAEIGWSNLRVGGDIRFYGSGVSAGFRPEANLDLGGESNVPGIAIREAWVGVQRGFGDDGLWFGNVGLRDRWIGPGRRGSLMLTNHAAPAPAISLGSEGALRPWLRTRAEIGAGWLNGSRGDVNDPGWLFMDFRWIPLPGIELGASRVGIFGGEDRPRPSFGQLLLPTDPHVYDDPEGLLPDQDEIAALDARINLPLDRWLDLASLRYLEFWWQYGAEDIIAAETRGVRYPSLAGIANLYGAELALRDWSVTAEGVRIFDDYFRWYTGHRIYHDGFTRDGMNMAHWIGGDTLSGWLSLLWLPETRGIEVWGERITRIGVVENIDDRLLGLSTEEELLRFGIRGWQARSDGGWWRLSIGAEEIRGENFVPGATSWRWRIAIEA